MTSALNHPKICGTCGAAIDVGDVYMETVGGAVRCITCASGGAREAAAVGSRAAILETAREAVTKDRAATHGAVESSFAQIAAIWSVRLGVTVTPSQVAILMIDLKTVRGWGNPRHLDNWIDMAGYAACGGELAGGET